MPGERPRSPQGHGKGELLPGNVARWAVLLDPLQAVAAALDGAHIQHSGPLVNGIFDGVQHGVDHAHCGWLASHAQQVPFRGSRLHPGVDPSI